MQDIIDIKAAQTKGALAFPKVRLIWKDRILRAYDASGLRFVVKSDRPVRRCSYMPMWGANTAEGKLGIMERHISEPEWALVAGKTVERLING